MKLVAAKRHAVWEPRRPVQLQAECWQAVAANSWALRATRRAALPQAPCRAANASRREPTT
jgi:hypothetical protein